MKKFQKVFAAIKLSAIATVVFLSSCSTEEEMIAPETTSAPTTETASAAEEIEAGSLTVSGIYTEVQETTDCASCTYVVPKNATVVDGKELGFAPGSVICLDKAIRYNNLEFTNLEGTAESPIIISHCGN